MQCFNSSQVGYKLRVEACSALPHSSVSIPHRLATNTAADGATIDIQDGFNSSQVGYKRVAWWSSSLPAAPFQFLIGWLQTGLNVPLAVLVNVFQFLIGWLQTYLRTLENEALQRGFNSSQVGYKLVTVQYTKESKIFKVRSKSANFGAMFTIKFYNNITKNQQFFALWIPFVEVQDFLQDWRSTTENSDGVRKRVSKLSKRV